MLSPASVNCLLRGLARQLWQPEPVQGVPLPGCVAEALTLTEPQFSYLRAVRDFIGGLVAGAHMSTAGGYGFVLVGQGTKILHAVQ